VNHDAIYQVYPNVVYIDGTGAFDANNNPVEIDEDAIQKVTEDIVQKQAIAIVKRHRASAYCTETDPLFFKAQRGECSLDDWQAKVAEVRSRFPYPDPKPSSIA
jgi:hypothetical protein